MKKEKWSAIKDYEKYYLISSYGNVISLHRNKKMQLKPISNIEGYLSVFLTKPNTKIISKRVHRLVAEAFIPNPENKKQVNHKDGVKYHNHHSNLEWCTNSENVQHSFDNGLQIAPVGEQHHLSKLSNKQVLEIFNSTLSNIELAKKYKTERTNISSIRSGKTWGTVTGKKYINNKEVRRKRAQLIYNSNMDYKELAKVYNLTLRTVYQIKKGDTWG